MRKSQHLTRNKSEQGKEIMQHKSRPHVRRLKQPKIPSNEIPYICEDDDKFDEKKIFDMYESEFHVLRMVRRAVRWFKYHKTIPIHKAPRHIKEKLSYLQSKIKNA